MSRRMFARSMNGEIAQSFTQTTAKGSLMNVSSICFGATGVLGNYIHQAALMHNHTMLVPFRFRSGASGVRMLRALGTGGTLGQNFDTDFELDKEFVVKSMLEKVDHVFNAIGAWQEPAVYEHSQSWFSMEAINVEWPRMLARWCREMGILRLVHVSMVGADLNSPSKLLRQKAMAEQAVLEEFPTATIIRSSDIFAFDDVSYSRYFKAQRYWKVVPVVNGGQRIHQPVFAGDIGEACCRALLLDHSEGRIAELGGPVRFTTNDLLRYCADCNGQNHLICHVPKWAWKIGTAITERLPLHKGALMGGKPQSWNQDWVERQFIDNCAVPERDPELMDWEDFGIPQEDLFRLEEKYFIPSLMWTKENPILDYGRVM
jgi:NADH dehydrogenase (ubiquinone) 1 alpha subcomplex subunit 9